MTHNAGEVWQFMGLSPKAVCNKYTYADCWVWLQGKRFTVSCNAVAYPLL